MFEIGCLIKIETKINDFKIMKNMVRILINNSTILAINSIWLHQSIIMDEDQSLNSTLFSNKEP